MHGRPLLLVPLVCWALEACGSDGDKHSPPAHPPASGYTASMMNPADVEIGPVISGKNRSKGLPIHPTPSDLGGWQMPLGPEYEPHYVSFPHGSLEGKSRIEMRYAIEGGGDIIGVGCQGIGTLTVFFQAQGDDWNTDGKRWWATFASLPLGEGEYWINAALDSNWTSVFKMSASANPQQFQGALRSAARVGFTFGNCEGYGHGVRATQPGTFRLISFNVL